MLRIRHHTSRGICIIFSFDHYILVHIHTYSENKTRGFKQSRFRYIEALMMAKNIVIVIKEGVYPKIYFVYH